MGKGHVVPELLVEQLALEELSAGQTEEVTARLGGPDRAAEHVSSLRASDAEILGAHAPKSAAAEIARRYHQAARARAARRCVWIAVPAAAAATAAAVLFLGPATTKVRQGKRPRPRPAAEGAQGATLPKGPALMTVYRDRAGGIEILQDGDAVASGDLLQISYTANEAKHGVIFSLDGRGTVTLHFPRTHDHPTRLTAGGVRLLPYAYELDDAPEYERFFFVTSDRPIDVRAVLKAGRKLGADPKRRLRLPAGTVLRNVVTLKKTAKGEVRP